MSYDYIKALSAAYDRVMKNVNTRVFYHVGNIRYEMENYMWERGMWRGMRLF